MGDDNPFRYRGYYYDTDTGLYYLNSRYYDPELRRFISSDEYASTGQGQLGNNMFAYCLNNPVKYGDTDGKFVNTVIGALVGGITALVSNEKNVTATDILVGVATGAIAGATVDAAIATAGTAVPILIAAVGGGASGAANSIYSQYKKKNSFKNIDWVEVGIDAAIGAASNVLSLGMSCPKQRVTSGKMFDRLVNNSKNIVEEGAKKVAQHGSREIVKKANYNGIVRGNIALAIGESSIMSASNTFWTEVVVPCLR